jgi:hypothetical protein
MSARLKFIAKSSNDDAIGYLPMSLCINRAAQVLSAVLSSFGS